MVDDNEVKGPRLQPQVPLLPQVGSEAGNTVGNTMSNPEEDTEVDVEAAAPRTALTTKGMVVISARVVLGLSSVAVALFVVAAATWLPLPVLGQAPQSTTVTPEIAAQQRICAGPVLRLGDETGQDATTALSVGRADVVRSSTRGVPALEEMRTTQNTANSPSQRLVLAPPAPGEQEGILAGSQSQFVDSSDLVGFAAAQCAKPSLDSWLVGGSSTTGRTTLISLNNPSKVNATVNLTIYSESGLITATGTSGIVVPPGGQHILSLAGFAPGIQSPVVHVHSTGGQVVANLQESIIRTLTPGGVDIIGVTTPPQTLTVIPGITMTTHDDVAAVQSAAGYGDTRAVLRVFVPGSHKDGENATTEARVSVIPEDGSTPTNSVLSVDVGVVTELPLGDFADGSYTISVATDLPAVVAARSSTVTLAAGGVGAGGGSETATGSGTASGNAADDASRQPQIEATDFAWFAGAAQLHEEALVSVAPGPQATLHLLNPAAKNADVSIESVTTDGVFGPRTTVTVPAGGAVAVPIDGGTSYRLSGFAQLVASVSYQEEGKLASFVLSPPARGAEPVNVFWREPAGSVAG